MYYVYMLRSTSHPRQTYIGSTGDLKKRLAEHNSGKSIHTNKFKPWKLEAYVALQHKELAEELEAYLKTGSGRAFANKHFRLPHASMLTTEQDKPVNLELLLRGEGSSATSTKILNS